MVRMMQPFLHPAVYDACEGACNHKAPYLSGGSAGLHTHPRNFFLPFREERPLRRVPFFGPPG